VKSYRMYSNNEFCKGTYILHSQTQTSSHFVLICFVHYHSNKLVLVVLNTMRYTINEVRKIHHIRRTLKCCMSSHTTITVTINCDPILENHYFGYNGQFSVLKFNWSTRFISVLCQNFSLISWSIPEIWPFYCSIHYKLTFMVWCTKVKCDK